MGGDSPQSSGDSTEPPNGEANSMTRAVSKTPVVSETSTASRTPHGSRRVVIRYLQAINEGNIDQAKELLHPDSMIQLSEDAEPGVTIHELNRVSTEAVVRRKSDFEGSELQQRVEDVEQMLTRLSEEVGADDHAYVFISITSAEYGDEESYIIVLKHDGEWLIWGNHGAVLSEYGDDEALVNRG